MKPVVFAVSHSFSSRWIRRNSALPQESKDATGVSRGPSRLPLKRTNLNSSQMPRACPVESHARCYLTMTEPPRRMAAASIKYFFRNVEANVREHGATPWHLNFSRAGKGVDTQSGFAIRGWNRSPVRVSFTVEVGTRLNLLALGTNANLTHIPYRLA
jgi:hypothetical protein